MVTYRVEHGPARLTRISDAASAPGAGPRHMAFTPDGAFAYVMGEMASTIMAFRCESEGGLTHLQTLSSLPAGYSGENSTADVRMHPRGHVVYCSNRGHDSIAVFSVNGRTGELAPLGHVSTGGRTPRGFNVDPTGTWLLAANEQSDSVFSFRVDGARRRAGPDRVVDRGAAADLRHLRPGLRAERGGPALYLNFFDDRLHHLRHGDLGLITDAYFSLYPEKKDVETVHCFFDEIQAAPGWEPFVDRLLRTERCQVHLTGSSAQLLSREIATQMRGRALSWEIFPFSFREYLDYRGIDAQAICRPSGASRSSRHSTSTGRGEAFPRSPAFWSGSKTPISCSPCAFSTHRRRAGAPTRRRCTASITP